MFHERFQRPDVVGGRLTVFLVFKNDTLHGVYYSYPWHVHDGKSSWTARVRPFSPRMICPPYMAWYEDDGSRRVEQHLVTKPHAAR